MQGFILTATTAAKNEVYSQTRRKFSKTRRKLWTDGRTYGQKVEPLYRTLLKAGAIKMLLIVGILTFSSRIND